MSADKILKYALAGIEPLVLEALRLKEAFAKKYEFDTEESLKLTPEYTFEKARREAAFKKKIAEWKNIEVDQSQYLQLLASAEAANKESVSKLEETTKKAAELEARRKAVEDQAAKTREEIAKAEAEIAMLHDLKTQIEIARTDLTREKDLVERQKKEIGPRYLRQEEERAKLDQDVSRLKSKQDEIAAKEAEQKQRQETLEKGFRLLQQQEATLTQTQKDLNAFVAEKAEQLAAEKVRRAHQEAQDQIDRKRKEHAELVALAVQAVQSVKTLYANLENTLDAAHHVLKQAGTELDKVARREIGSTADKTMLSQLDAMLRLLAPPEPLHEGTPPSQPPQANDKSPGGRAADASRLG